jgi:hypothetical protein
MPRPVLVALLALVPSLSAQDAPTPPPKDAYIKLRVEVEVRGTLKATDKGAVVLTRYSYFDAHNLDKAVPPTPGTPAFKVDLDFAKAKDAQELVKRLAGRDVIVTGSSELRHTTSVGFPGGGFGGGIGGVPPGGGFGFQGTQPAWQLHPTVLVTGLRPAPEKR